MRKEEQRQLCSLLTNLGAGQAEAESTTAFPKWFHPVHEHLKAFDPGVILIIGDRGSGKSELFNAIFENKLLDAITPYTKQATLPNSQNAAWLPAYPLHSNFPDARGLKTIYGHAVNEGEQGVSLWFAYLIRTLSHKIGKEDQEALKALLSPLGGDVEEVMSAFHQSGSRPLLALDRLDQKLQEQDQWIFVGYDELDTLGGYDWHAMATAVQGLIGFWASYARRWKRLRAKVFIRTDLFRRHTGLGGADLAKLSANRAELTWNDRNLFSILIKRIANVDDSLFNYCKNVHVPFESRVSDTLGHIPKLTDASDAFPLIERLIGQYMGANKNKGKSTSWVLDHLRDGRGRASPRDLVRLIEYAAGKESVNIKADPPRLIHPTALRQALEDVSNAHVLQATNNEWPWLRGVQDRLGKHEIPAEKNKMVEWLQSDWENHWGSSSPPATTPGELVEYLIELGVFKQRANGKIDVPDIFQYGFTLRRRGGVRRR